MSEDIVEWTYDPDAKQKYNNSTKTNVKHGEIGWSEHNKNSSMKQIQMIVR